MLYKSVNHTLNSVPSLTPYDLNTSPVSREVLLGHVACLSSLQQKPIYRRLPGLLLICEVSRCLPRFELSDPDKHGDVDRQALGVSGDPGPDSLGRVALALSGSHFSQALSVTLALEALLVPEVLSWFGFN